MVFCFIWIWLDLNILWLRYTLGYAGQLGYLLVLCFGLNLFC
jgi:hypothetical protein